MKNCIFKILYCQLMMLSFLDYFVCYSELWCLFCFCGLIFNQYDWLSLIEELDVFCFGQVEVIWFF